MNVAQMIDELLQREGGYVNHKSDRGGPTNHGITKTTLKAYVNRNEPDPIKHRNVSTDEVKNLTRGAAKMIYLELYYMGPRINELPDALRPLIFDMAVNHGANRAIKILQKALASFGYKNVTVDGKIGTQTITATSMAYTTFNRRLIDYIIDRRISFYQDIVADNPSQHVFLNGWTARAESFRVTENV